VSKPTKPQKEDIELLPPLKEGETSQLNIDILAQISQYTERPDLFLETLEKHDPGFIKRLTENSKDLSQLAQKSRFNFGRIQAYASLFIQIISAAIVLGGVAYLIYDKQASFTIIVALAIFYAITQGGSGGFNRIIHSISEAIKKFKS
jgi:hypothetical protein